VALPKPLVRWPWSRQPHSCGVTLKLACRRRRLHRNQYQRNRKTCDSKRRAEDFSFRRGREEGDARAYGAGARFKRKSRGARKRAPRM